MTDLEQLALKCETASGPDRELDTRIHFALNPLQKIMTDPGSVSQPKRDAAYCLLREFNLDTWEDWEGLSMIVGAKPVSASLDAAMTLVPRLQRNPPYDPEG